MRSTRRFPTLLLPAALRVLWNATAGNLAPRGIALDSEVEDYRVEIQEAAPSVVDVTINHGDSQRSSLTELFVTFDREVNAPASAFMVKNRNTDEIVDSLVVNSSVVDGRSVSHLAYSPGSHVIGGGLNWLIDGNYRLEIAGSQILATENGGTMASDYAFGEHAQDAFFRKYGDNNGNGIVDLLDFDNFRQTFGKSASDSGYLEAFDSDGNSSIGLLDFARFRQNFGS